jgi:predicted amidophosphoribosyltransferase
LTQSHNYDISISPSYPTSTIFKLLNLIAKGTTMQCPQCQFENLEGIKFCGECGAKLERLCPICNSSSPPNFKFCGECGHKFEIPVETYIKALSFDEKLYKIQRYLPKGLAEKILAQKDKIEGENARNLGCEC